MRRRGGALLLVLALLLAPAGVSVARALTAPGQATTSVRLVEWVRDHGGSRLVDTVENWWYSQAPSRGPIDPSSVPASTSSPAPPVTGPQPGPVLPASPPSLPGETVWVPSARRVGRAAPLYTTFFRPLTQAPELVVGAAWMNQALVRAAVAAGTQDPPPPKADGRPVDGGGAQIPARDRASLLATFNSGFRTRDARGGFYTGGRWVLPPVAGAASIVVDTAGRIALGAWGDEVNAGPGTVTVRQNLAMVVDHGAPVAGLDADNGHFWGSSDNQHQFTWRSGLGLDHDGNLIYVAANKISLSDLADAMVAAGVERGMQLDMHPQLVTFMSYAPGVPARGTKLLPAMVPSTTRYLVPNQRDFIAISSAAR